MLKITTAVLSKHETTLRLDGRVAGQWVGLLKESAESALTDGLKLTIDLKNISFIDCEGIALLKTLIGRGADPINAPLFVTEQIKKCNDGPG
jgi:ABC-type transporter Mla MlaB component